MGTLRARIERLALGVLVAGCGAEGSPTPEEPAEPEVSTQVLPTSDCQNHPLRDCANSESCPGATLQDWCALHYSSIVTFWRGEGDCFTLALSFEQANFVSYNYTGAGNVQGCSISADGQATIVDGVYECTRVAGDDTCVVCGRDELLQGSLEAQRWCDSSDALPVSLDGMARDRTGVE
jgi:hypothetical protein